MKAALFVDFDNVYSGLRRISAQAAERFARRPALWLQWLTEELEPIGAATPDSSARRVLVRRCYLNPVMFSQYRRPFHEAGFEIVDCPPMTAAGKTTTDIHLVLDAMDALADSTRFDEFIVFSADADFSPVLRRLRRHDRRTAVFAAGAMSEAYKASADRVIGVPEFLRDGLDTLPEASEELPTHPGAVLTCPPDLVAAVGNLVRHMVREAPGPVPLATVASALLREFPVLRDGRWGGTGSFSNLMRQMAPAGVSFDFEADRALDQQRLQASAPRQTPAPERADQPSQDTPPSPAAAGHAPPLTAAPGLHLAAAQLIRQWVDASPRPVLLSLVGQELRKALPALGADWGGGKTLAGFLRQLDLQPLQRIALEDGSTIVLLDPSRHELPKGQIADPLVAAMLRAAELPAIPPEELTLVLQQARVHMGASEAFELGTVSQQVYTALAGQGTPVSLRRITAVLQGLIFGGLDTAQPCADPAAFEAAAMGVVLAAWARETQSPADDEARRRLMAWWQGEAAQA